MSIAYASIQKNKLNADGHTEYFIKVDYLGKSWSIRKRYRDFSHFDDVLKSQNIFLLVDLPPRSWWNRLDPDFLTKRQKLLQSYLDCLFCHPLSPENSLVKEFLEVDHQFLQNEIETFRENKKILEKKDKLKEIVNNNSKKLIVFDNPVIKVKKTKYSSKSNKSASVNSNNNVNKSNNNSFSSSLNSPTNDRMFSLEGVRSTFRLSSSWGSVKSNSGISPKATLVDLFQNNSVNQPLSIAQQLTFDTFIHSMNSITVKENYRLSSDRSAAAFEFEDKEDIRIISIFNEPSISTTSKLTSILDNVGQDIRPLLDNIKLKKHLEDIDNSDSLVVKNFKS